jgi:hypothetical protein
VQKNQIQKYGTISKFFLFLNQTEAHNSIWIAGNDISRVLIFKIFWGASSWTPYGACAFGAQVVRKPIHLNDLPPPPKEL